MDFARLTAGCAAASRPRDGVEWRPICSPLTVTAMLRDGASSSWGVVVHFDDADGRPHDVPLPAEVYGDPIAVAMLLMRRGLPARRRFAPDPHRIEHDLDEVETPGAPHGHGDTRLD